MGYNAATIICGYQAPSLVAGSADGFLRGLSPIRPGLGKDFGGYLTDQTERRPPSARRSERLLLLFFFLSLPFLNPWVRGDGVGYYAFARAPLIQHNLDFTEDYRHANESFRAPRLDENNQPRAGYRTATGHLENHFTTGPAILWAPFLVVTHVAVLVSRALGSSVSADGFSSPYRITMALATAFYAFFGLLLAFRLARQYVAERWALLATLAVWWASSLPVYMYFNPSWSHAHSSFVVALFLWFWHESRSSRSLMQWVMLALISALMLNVYYANAMVLAVLVVEAVRQYYISFGSKPGEASDDSNLSVRDLVFRHLLFAVVLILGLIPTFLSRYIIYGNPFESGYVSLRQWLWTSPAFFSVLFSSNHGLFSWTPILLLAVFGLFVFWRRQRRPGTPFLAAFLAFYFFISCYPDWAGISSYGNRFFVSLTPLFVIGLAVFFERLAQLFSSPRTGLVAVLAVLSVSAVWNAGFIFQWGSHLIPARGPISLSQVAHNQFALVPRLLFADLERYLFKRRALMQQIEDRDLQQLKDNPPPE